MQPFSSQSSDYEIGLLAAETAPPPCARCPVARVQDRHRPRDPEVNIVYVPKVLPHAQIFITARTRNKDTYTRVNSHTYTHDTHERFVGLRKHRGVLYDTRNFLRVLRLRGTSLSTAFSGCTRAISDVLYRRGITGYGNTPGSRSSRANVETAAGELHCIILHTFRARAASRRRIE